MNALAEKYARRDVHSVFLYTHEAHPGEHYPHLESIEQKFRHAHALRDEYGVTRPIGVDALDGAAHRRYGSMPNMTWIFDRRGTAVYKSDWTDVRSVEAALEMFLGLGERRKGGERLAPFRVERAEFRALDRPAFMQGLERAGPKAVREFRDAFREG